MEEARGWILHIILFTLEGSWELQSAGTEEMVAPELGTKLSSVPWNCTNTGPISKQEGMPLVISQTQPGGVRTGAAFLERNSAVLCKFVQAVCTV